MHTIGVLKARSTLPELLKRVALKGEHITITNRGEPMADLVPSSSTATAIAREAIQAIKSMRTGKINQKNFTEMRQRGRR